MLFFEALKLGYLIHLHPLDNAHAEHTTTESTPDSGFSFFTHIYIL